MIWRSNHEGLRYGRRSLPGGATNEPYTRRRAKLFGAADTNPKARLRMLEDRLGIWW